MEIPVVPFRKKTSLPPPPDGLIDYWAIVHVRLAEPLPVCDSDEDPVESPSSHVIGYYRNFGLRCTSSSLREVLSHAVEDGMIDWNDTEISEALPFRNLHRDIRARVVPVAGEGIWYSSGRNFYPTDEDEDGGS
jgi:hypothetical protein